MSDKLVEFKNELVEHCLLPAEDLVRKVWPNQSPKITLLIRTPWLPDGGILITNETNNGDAITELVRLSKKEKLA